MLTNIILIGIPLMVNYLHIIKWKIKFATIKIKKHGLSQKQKLYNNIKKYLEDDISDEKLDKALYYYVGKKNNITYRKIMIVL